MIAVRDLDAKKYGRLLARTLPLVIESEQELRRAHEVVETLMANKARTREETELLRLVAQLIQDYETRGRTEPASKPHEILQFLIEENGLKQKDLLDIFGTRSIASEAVRGRRGITKRQAVMLGNRFKVSPELFIDSSCLRP
ncbi:MAG TPA: transcriptional regulator [Blastocatellia bacterium]|jgi:HTH-type transcriptional regulator/antitoxin HigA|nr:transcriptional regulator [Blastocatellia bacterium]